MQRRAFQIEQNRHLGMNERNNHEASVAIEEEKSGAPGAAANIDETANIGQPANNNNTG